MRDFRASKYVLLAAALIYITCLIVASWFARFCPCHLRFSQAYRTYCVHYLLIVCYAVMAEFAVVRSFFLCSPCFYFRWFWGCLLGLRPSIRHSSRSPGRLAGSDRYRISGRTRPFGMAFSASGSPASLLPPVWQAGLNQLDRLGRYALKLKCWGRGAVPGVCR